MLNQLSFRHATSFRGDVWTDRGSGRTSYGIVRVVDAEMAQIKPLGGWKEMITTGDVVVLLLIGEFEFRDPFGDLPGSGSLAADPSEADWRIGHDDHVVSAITRRRDYPQVDMRSRTDRD
jgi:hypothetical protein